MEISEWKAVLEREREEKNRFFATHRLVPRENWLEVAIPAGEKDFPLKK